jgi:hypothetical protein
LIFINVGKRSATCGKQDKANICLKGRILPICIRFCLSGRYKERIFRTPQVTLRLPTVMKIWLFKPFSYIELTLKSRNMKVVLDIKDSKASFVMELLDSFSFVKIQPITNEKALLLREIREAVDTVNLVKKGKIQARPAKELLNEI